MSRRTGLGKALRSRLDDPTHRTGSPRRVSYEYTYPCIPVKPHDHRSLTLPPPARSEAAVALGTPARARVAEIERAPALPRLGAPLYRLQHGARLGPASPARISIDRLTGRVCSQAR